MTVRDVYDFLNSIAPFETQEGWDNSGLLVGSMNSMVSRIGVVLDITPRTVGEAALNRCDLMISHHPVIFNPLKSFSKESAVYSLAACRMNAICAHTNLDCAQDGVSDALAERLLLGGVEAVPTSISPLPPVRGGAIKKSMEAQELADFLSERLNSPCVRYYAPRKRIKTLAVCGGAGTDYLHEAAEKNFDAFVTGDAKHSDFLDAAEWGIALFAAGHFETEYPAIPKLTKRLVEAFPTLAVSEIKQTPPILSK